KHSGDGYSLLLSAEKKQRITPELIGQLHYLVMNISLPRSFTYILIGCIRIAIPGIFFNGSAKKYGFAAIPCRHYSSNILCHILLKEHHPKISLPLWANRIYPAN